MIRVLELLTRSSDVAEDEYYARIAAHPDAREVKLADLADNTNPARLALLQPADRERLNRKYAGAYTALAADPADGFERRGTS